MTKKLRDIVESINDVHRAIARQTKAIHPEFSHAMMYSNLKAAAQHYQAAPANVKNQLDMHMKDRSHYHDIHGEVMSHIQKTSEKPISRERGDWLHSAYSWAHHFHEANACASIGDEKGKAEHIRLAGEHARYIVPEGIASKGVHIFGKLMNAPRVRTDAERDKVFGKIYDDHFGKNESVELTEMTKYADYPRAHAVIDEMSNNGYGHGQEGLHEIPTKLRPHMHAAEQELRSQGHTPDTARQHAEKYHMHMQDRMDNGEDVDHDGAWKATRLGPHTQRLVDKYFNG